jgi:hypothetical protein
MQEFPSALARGRLRSLLALYVLVFILSVSPSHQSLGLGMHSFFPAKQWHQVGDAMLQLTGIRLSIRP